MESTFILHTMDMEKDKINTTKEINRFKFTNLAHNLVLFIVVLFSLAAYPMFMILTLMDINQLDVSYVQEPYTSEYSLKITGLDEKSLIFSSEVDKPCGFI